MALKDRTGDIIIVERGTRECAMGDRNITNPLCGSQRQHHNDQNPVDERGRHRDQRRTRVDASGYSSYAGSPESDETLDIPWSQNRQHGGTGGKESDPIGAQHLSGWRSSMSSRLGMEKSLREGT